VPTSTCWSYLLGESPSHQRIPPTTPTLVLPESAYQYLLVLPVGCKPQPPRPTLVLLESAFQYLLGAAFIPFCSLPTYLQKWSKTQEEGVSTLSSCLSIMEITQQFFLRIFTLYSSLSSLENVFQVLPSPLYQILKPSPRSLPCMMLPIPSPALG
jgi:hypothetical protein